MATRIKSINQNQSKIFSIENEFLLLVSIEIN
jgi:hypothetical protein